MPTIPNKGGSRPKTPTAYVVEGTHVARSPTGGGGTIVAATKAKYHQQAAQKGMMQSPSGQKGLSVDGAVNGNGNAAPVKYQDLWAAVLFLLHVVVMLWVALGPGLKALRSTDVTTQPSGASEAGADMQSASLMYGGFAVLLGVGAVWSQVIINILVRVKSYIIEASLAFSVGTCVVGAAVAVVGQAYILAALAAFGAVLQLMWWYCVRSRVPFASANLYVAVSAVQAHCCSAMGVALCLTLVNACWVLVWALAASGVALLQPSDKVVLIEGMGSFLPSQCTTVGGNRCVCNGLEPALQSCEALTQMQAQVSGGLLFLLLLSLQWGSLVVKEVLFCAMSGTVADWWFNGARSAGNVLRSLSRACTTSLGSVCVGALLIAILKTLRQIVRSATRDEEENCASCVVQCILQCLEDALKYFNRYTMVYVSLYGGSFVESGKKVFELFNTRGFTAIINDDLVESAMSLVCVVVGLVTAVVGVVYGKIVGLADPYVLALGAIGFFVGLVVGSIVLGVVDAAVATVFVCWAEDPSPLARREPDLFNTMVQAWAKMGYDVETGTVPMVPSQLGPAQRPQQNRTRY